MAASFIKPGMLAFVSMLVVFGGISCHGPNIALNRPAFMSSAQLKWGFRPASLATDGITARNDNNKCFHTQWEHNPWWAVDLGKMSSVKSVFIVNRNHHKGDRFSHFKILVSNVSPDVFKYSETNPGLKECIYYKKTIAQGQKITIHCSKTTVGRYVYIVRLGRDALILCEVKVYADPDVKPAEHSDDIDLMVLLPQCHGMPNTSGGKVTQLTTGSNMTREVAIAFGPHISDCPLVLAVGTRPCYLTGRTDALRRAIGFVCVYTCDSDNRSPCHTPDSTPVRVGKITGSSIEENIACETLEPMCHKHPSLRSRT